MNTEESQQQQQQPISILKKAGKKSSSGLGNIHSLAHPSQPENLSTDIVDPWTHVLNCQNYDGSCEITISSKQIKESKTTWKGPANQFEPRNFAYQMSSESRPDIFKKNGIYMFPVKNGTYMLTKNKIYENLDYTPVETIIVNRDTSSLLLSIGNSESSFIDNLRYSGVFERPEFLNEPITHGSLLNGRHRCNFEMKLGDTPYSIKGVQYEADSCFESSNKILIIEGKNTNARLNSFNIRQLYFPYREIFEKTKAKKEIICLFIHNCVNVVHIWKYHFAIPTQMDSIVLSGHYMFKFNS